MLTESFGEKYANSAHKTHAFFRIHSKLIRPTLTGTKQWNDGPDLLRVPAIHRPPRRCMVARNG